MGTEKRRPSWWQLWLLVPALAGLAYLEVRAPLSLTGHRLVEAAILIVVFSLVALWLRSNDRALLCEWSDDLRLRQPDRKAVLPLASPRVADLHTPSPPLAGLGHRGTDLAEPGNSNGRRSTWILFTAEGGYERAEGAESDVRDA